MFLEYLCFNIDFDNVTSSAQIQAEYSQLPETTVGQGHTDSEQNKQPDKNLHYEIVSEKKNIIDSLKPIVDRLQFIK